MKDEMGCRETNVGYADRNSAREAAIQSVQKPEVKRPGSGMGQYSQILVTRAKRLRTPDDARGASGCEAQRQSRGKSGP